MLTKEIKHYIEKSILCWLATSSLDNIPNVSPKEIFMAYQDDSIIIANIASPRTVKNIKANENVAISFIDIFIQKGFQLKGKAQILTAKDTEYENIKSKLEEMTQGKFPFSSITKIVITAAKPILSPRYLLYPETTEENQIAAAKKDYGIG